jgi:uncharacterized protein
MNEWGLILGAVGAGLMTSFHCVGMCAPLACSLMKSDSWKQNSFFVVQYHLGRLVSYGLMGGLAGSLGAFFFEGVSIPLLQVVAWFFVIVYFLLAWGWEFKMTPGSWGFQISQWFYPWMMKFRNRSGFSLGAITPLLPCTPLYLSASAAFLSGNGLLGMAIMMGFVLGTFPLYIATQFLWFRMQMNGDRWRWMWIRRGFALLGMGMMVWRLTTGEFMSSGSASHGFGFPCFETGTTKDLKADALSSSENR